MLASSNQDKGKWRTVKMQRQGKTAKEVIHTKQQIYFQNYVSRKLRIHAIDE